MCNTSEIKKQDKIIKLGVEGGSISIYKFLDEKGNDWYYYNTQVMSYDGLGLNGVDRKSKDNFMSFPEAMVTMLGEYKNSMSYYPVYINLDFQPVIVAFLKAYRKDITMHKERWFELLEIKESIHDKDILEDYD